MRFNVFGRSQVFFERVALRSQTPPRFNGVILDVVDWGFYGEMDEFYQSLRCRFCPWEL